ncbi:protein serine/threonine phosphatase 2C, partial [Myriangium duriaei CBS 260.36]
QRRVFHDYFVTHLPSSSLHPDSKNGAGPNHHKLPRGESTPHTAGDTQRIPSALSQALTQARNTTVVRIPLKSAKHHFGASSARGSRPYNEDAFQAGTIEIPAFAKRQPLSISRRPNVSDESNKQAQSASGDPQVFYFGVFDGHGGEECSAFLRDRLHGYLEDAAEKFGMRSSLRTDDSEGQETDRKSVVERGMEMQKALLASWKETVGGYFKRFQPEYFISLKDNPSPDEHDDLSLEAMLTFAFLKADLDFTRAQAQKQSSKPAANDPVLDDRPINDTDVLSHPLKPASQNLTTLLQAPIGGTKRFTGGSTCSVALVSTPTPMPFWNPASPCTLSIAHVGDTRILLCRVSDGAAVPLTTNHHPSTPVEATRLRRYAASFVTDSFGEERMAGLANTRAFGDIASKRLGVSAEPQVATVHAAAGEYSFLTLISDGVSGTLSDQEVVDIVKEARTPEQACRDVTAYATEVGEDGDNATCLVVRLGGWERRSENGGGSLGTAERREYRRREAEDPRAKRR